MWSCHGSWSNTTTSGLIVRSANVTFGGVAAHLARAVTPTVGRGCVVVAVARRVAVVPALLVVVPPIIINIVVVRRGATHCVSHVLWRASLTTTAGAAAANSIATVI